MIDYIVIIAIKLLSFFSRWIEQNIINNFLEFVKGFEHGAKILKLHRITRNIPETQYPLQNADFSVATIKELIKQGETKVLDYLKQ